VSKDEKWQHFQYQPIVYRHELNLTAFMEVNSTDDRQDMMHQAYWEDLCSFLGSYLKRDHHTMNYIQRAVFIMRYNLDTIVYNEPLRKMGMLARRCNQRRAEF
jgi:hypothetical protein